ncbi:MAG: exodeoxyribonuclease VII small subunit [Oscillospiraceae bacterium]
MKKTMTFEQAMDKLEAITQQLSDPKLSLDASMALYTEATQLINFCNTKLSDAKNMMDKLSEERLTDEQI